MLHTKTSNLCKCLELKWHRHLRKFASLEAWHSRAKTGQNLLIKNFKTVVNSEEAVVPSMLDFLLSSSSSYTTMASWLNWSPLAENPPFCLQLSLSSAHTFFLFEEKYSEQECSPWMYCQWNKDADLLILNSEQSKGWSGGTRELWLTLPAAKRWHPLTASKTFGETSGWAGRWDWARDCFTFFTSTRHRALSSPGNKKRVHFIKGELPIHYKSLT